MARFVTVTAQSATTDYSDMAEAFGYGSDERSRRYLRSCQTADKGTVEAAIWTHYLSAEDNGLPAAIKVNVNKFRKDIGDQNGMLVELGGEDILVTVKQSTSKKNGKEYINFGTKVHTAGKSFDLNVAYIDVATQTLRGSWMPTIPGKGYPPKAVKEDVAAYTFWLDVREAFAITMTHGYGPKGVAKKS